MNEKQIEVIGYHGTLKEKISLIKRNGFDKSDGGWLGTGIYFFQDDFELAIKWAKKKYRTDNVQFIKKKICVDSKKLFDITWPLSKQSKYYFQERERYIKEMTRRGYEINVENKKRYENSLVNLICNSKGYEVVRACTYTYQKYDYIGGKEIDSIFANGVELSVRNAKSII
ncbi:hypothetical protein FDB25_15810 [Clostridium botulinum]|nr:hypothetical protein [Clostridium botulinum]